MNAFGGKEISEIVLRLLFVGIVVAELLAIPFDSVSKFSFWFPCLSNIFFLTCVTDDNIYEVKTIACETGFQFKSNLNVFKVVVIIYQEVAAAFTSFITTAKRTS